ncbi:MAG: hypothetical protein Q8L34_04975 [Candidatus Woesearchaeota archaeon]|nr:hypothetical protein [Candidatus Woesearchaeota archaeon]
MNKLLSLTLFLLLVTLASSFAEAAYVYGSYGTGYSSPYTLERGAYYPNSGRTNVYDESFSFPRGRGDLYYNTNRDSLTNSLSQSQTTDRRFNEDLIDNFFGSQTTYGRNLIDNQDQTTSRQYGTGFDTGSADYRYGDCSTPSYQRTLQGNYKGSRNDFTITETVCGGEQINLNRNFGNTNGYTNTANTNRRTLQDSLFANTAVQTRNVDRTTQDTQQTRNTYSLQQSRLGQGYTLVFN